MLPSPEEQNNRPNCDVSMRYGLLVNHGVQGPTFQNKCSQKDDGCGDSQCVCPDKMSKLLTEREDREETYKGNDSSEQ
jgi:hypothetical protein